MHSWRRSPSESAPIVDEQREISRKYPPTFFFQPSGLNAETGLSFRGGGVVNVRHNRQLYTDISRSSGSSFVVVGKAGTAKIDLDAGRYSQKELLANLLGSLLYLTEGSAVQAGALALFADQTTDNKLRDVAFREVLGKKMPGHLLVGIDGRKRIFTWTNKDKSVQAEVEGKLMPEGADPTGSRAAWPAYRLTLRVDMQEGRTYLGVKVFPPL